MKIKRSYKVLIISLALSLLIIIPFGTRYLWLPFIAEILVSHDSLGPSDAIVVLSGGIPMRNQKAAQLFYQGLAPKIITSGSSYDNYLIQFFGRKITSAKLNALVLSKNLKVPIQSIIALEEPVSGTYDEAKALRHYIQKNGGLHSLILVTSGFHSQRAKWIYKKVFKGMNMKITAVEASHPFFNTSDWWLCEEGLIAVSNEYIKFIYYIIEYLHQ